MEIIMKITISHKYVNEEHNLEKSGNNDVFFIRAMGFRPTDNELKSLLEEVNFYTKYKIFGRGI